MPTSPTRFTHGVTDFPPFHPAMAQYLHLNPFSACFYEDDFMNYTAGNWTVTASTGTTALAAGNGGLVVQTTSTTGSDVQHNLKNPLSIALTSTNRFWFLWRGKVDTVSNSVWVLGLTGALTSFVPTDGVYLSKAAAATNLVLNVRKSSTSTTASLGGTIADATNIVAGFFYDAKASPTIYAFMGTSTTMNSSNSPGQFITSVVAVTDMTNLPTANLGVSFGVQTNTTATRALTTDYILGATEITR